MSINLNNSRKSHSPQRKVAKIKESNKYNLNSLISVLLRPKNYTFYDCFISTHFVVEISQEFMNNPELNNIY